MATLLDLEQKLKDLFAQGSKTVGNIVNQGIQNFNKPLTAPGIGNTQPINYQQLGSNIGNVLQNYAKTHFTPLPADGRIIRPENIAKPLPAKYVLGNQALTDFAQNQIRTPIYQGVTQMQKPGVVNKAIGAAQIGQGLFSATPAGMVYNTLQAPVIGGIKSLRTGTDFAQNTKDAFTKPADIAGTGLGITNPALALGIDVLSGNPKGVVKNIKNVKNIALSFKDISPNVNNIHPEDLNRIHEILDVVRSTPKGVNLKSGPILEDAKLLAGHYLGKKWTNQPIEKIAKAFEAAVDLNAHLPQDVRAPFPSMNLVGNDPQSVGDILKSKNLGSTLPSKPIISGKERKLITSVKEAQNVLPDVKTNVVGMYTPKSNKKLMGEAQALLQEGANLDLKHVRNVDQKVAATIQSAISQQDKNPQLAANLFNNLSEQGTELGRGVQAFSLLDKMSPEAIALSAAGKIKKYNRTAIRKIPELNGEQVKLISDKVDALSQLKPGTREHNIAVNDLSKTINEFIPSSLVDKALTVWKAGLLTSLRTHERNLVGNAIMGGAETAKDIIASPIDKLMSLRTGKRSLTFNMQGAGQGTMKGLQAGKDIIKYGFDPEQTIAKFDQKSITWGKNPLEQALKKGTDAVFRTLGAEDKPFLHGATARSLYDQAKAEAINAGKQGDKTFIEKLISNPTPEMIKIAEKDANYATFHDKNIMSGVANAIKKAASRPEYKAWGEFGKAVTEILAPFTGVPSSIIGKTIDYSPVGLAKGAVNVGRVLAGNMPELQRQAAQEIGRGVIGSGLFGLGAYLMSKGLMTGQPKDAKEADLWAAEGKQANSVLINGQWKSINSIGPQNLVMLAGAKYQEEMGKSGGGDVGAYAASLGKDQLSQTFLAGVQGPLNAITDPARYGKSYVGNQIASTVPNIIKDVSKSLDPYQRENNTVQDYITNSLPLLRNKNIEKRDVLGNIMKQEPTGVGAFVDLFNSKTPIKNDVLSELDRLNSVGESATPGKLAKNQTIQGVKQILTPEQLNTLESQVGPQVTQALDSLIKDPSYQQLSDTEKANAVSNTVAQIRKQVRGTIDLSQSNSTFAPQTLGAQSTGLSGQYTLIDPATGSIRRIDLSKPIEQPVATGAVSLDKLAISKYNAALSSRANDIYELYKSGKITQEQAGTAIDELVTQKITKPKKPKKISIRMARVPAIKTTVAKSKKSPTFKLKKSPTFKISKSKKSPTFKLKKSKNSVLTKKA